MEPRLTQASIKWQSELTVPSMTKRKKTSHCCRCLNRLLHQNSASKKRDGHACASEGKNGITQFRCSICCVMADGFDPATLSRIEQGTRTLTDIEILAFLRALGRKWQT